MATRQQLEAQLVAAHRSGNVAAAQQAAYAIRAFDQNSLMAQVPTVNAPAVNRPVQPRWDDMLTQFSQGLGSGIKSQLQGVEQIATQPVESAKALYQAGVEAFRDPAKALGEAWSGIRSTAERAVSSPMGFGQVLGENVNIVRMPGGRRQPTQAELDVYHGTPHTFEAEEGAPLGRFRSSKIGTGEGKQMYGYGLYLSEHPEVASSYKIGLTNPALHFTQELEDVLPDILKGKAADWADEIQSGKTFGDLLATVRYPWQKTLLQQQKAPIENLIKRQQTGGSLYKVDLPDAKIEQMLDWDKPLSQQPAMQKAFDKFWKGLSKNERAQAVFDEFGDYDLAEQMAKNPGEVRGRLAYTLMTHHFGDQAAASDFLRQQGVPGIKYLDAGSRAGEKGTRNFVVFPGEEQNLTILERDGVKAEVPKPDAPKPTTWRGMSRDEFLGNPKITTNRNASDLKPRALTTVVTEQPKPFKGNLTIRMNEDGAAVYDGDKVIASYNFGDTLVVDKKYRKQGIGEELVYQWRKANPTAPPATERTKASQAIQEKVWQRLLNEQG